MHVTRPENEAKMGESEDIALYPGHKQVVWDLLLVWHVCEAIGGASKI